MSIRVSDSTKGKITSILIKFDNGLYPSNISFLKSFGTIKIIILLNPKEDDLSDFVLNEININPSFYTTIKSNFFKIVNSVNLPKDFNEILISSWLEFYKLFLRKENLANVIPVINSSNNQVHLKLLSALIPRNTQDFIEVFTDKKNIYIWFQEDEILEESQTEITQILGAQSYKPTSISDFIIPGGNLIAGKNFLLIGNHECKAYSIENIAKFYGYKKDKIKHIGFECLENVNEVYNFSVFNKDFFHLDLFLTYVGTAHGKPIFLLANVVNEDKKTAQYYNTALAKIASQLRKLLGEITILKVPCLILGTSENHIHDTTQSPATIIGYNNILVSQNSNGKMYFMLPEYRLNKVTTESHKRLSRQLFEIKNETLKVLTGTLSGEIRFIDYNFYDLSFSKKTGLHCAVKILQRS